MIVVTGGAGFIGANLIHGLNRRGLDDILVVDQGAAPETAGNLAGARIRDSLDREEFRRRLEADDPALGAIDLVFHQGACTDTTERDGRYMLDTNYLYSKSLLEYCLRHDIRLIYASSAAVYGVGEAFAEEGGHESPVNVYGYSKYLFDCYAMERLAESGGRVAGLRYFNVYGPRETHKGRMASVMLHFDRQLRDTGEVCLFRGSDGYADGEQRRDFIHVDDVVDVNLWFMDHPDVSGVFNVGTGVSRSFNDVANAILAWHGHGRIRYIDFPPELAGAYQSFTEADLAKLTATLGPRRFLGLEEGVGRYLAWLNP